MSSLNCLYFEYLENVNTFVCNGKELKFGIYLFLKAYASSYFCILYFSKPSLTVSKNFDLLSQKIFSLHKPTGVMFSNQYLLSLPVRTLLPPPKKEIVYNV